MQFEGKKMRMNLVQSGFSIVMGWFIVLVGNLVVQPIVHRGGYEVFWDILVLGLGLTGLGFVRNERIISGSRAGTLLQIGVVVTFIWVMILLQMEGPHDLGLPKPNINVGRNPEGVSQAVPLFMIVFFILPVLGLILLTSGTVLKWRTAERDLWGKEDALSQDRIRRVMEKLKDERSKKVVFLAHRLLKARFVIVNALAATSF